MYLQSESAYDYQQNHITNNILLNAPAHAGWPPHYQLKKKRKGPLWLFLEVCLTQDHVPHAASHGSLLLDPYPREAPAPALPPSHFRGASAASALVPTLRPWASVSKAPSGVLVPLDFQATKVAPHSLQLSRISEPCCALDRYRTGNCPLLCYSLSFRHQSLA